MDRFTRLKLGVNEKRLEINAGLAQKQKASNIYAKIMASPGPGAITNRLFAEKTRNL
jgi:hypothetical protein